MSLDVGIKSSLFLSRYDMWFVNRETAAK
jgi:hypothetical protein